MSDLLRFVINLRGGRSSAVSQEAKDVPSDCRTFPLPLPLRDKFFFLPRGVELLLGVLDPASLPPDDGVRKSVWGMRRNCSEN